MVTAAAGAKWRRLVQAGEFKLTGPSQSSAQAARQAARRQAAAAAASGAATGSPA